ncbi:MAG: DNA polymerase I [Eubacteriaceae bacterium]|nr:DNA polymerase I [Eubacteriaceae bacterium]
MEKRIIIIDGNSLINRAYYAMQKPMITKEGLYTQGVYGFLNMLGKISKDHPAGYIAVTFDLKAPTFRHKEYDQYKAGRKKMPPELAMQMPLLKDVLEAMNIKMISLEGFEADDLIGTIAREAEESGLEPLIITGDKDELQLASDKTDVMITKRGISQFKIYDHDEMVKEYGFTPTQFIDYKGLMGDTSDNIPGLPGVGPKTAQKLILDHGSVEGVLENTDKLKGKLKENVEDNTQLALMSKRLATINRNVPIEIDFEEYKWEDPDHEKLVDIYKKLEFNSFLKKMGKDLSEEEKETANSYEELSVEPVIIRNIPDMKKLSGALKKQAIAVIKVFGDNDHRGKPSVFGAGLLVDDKYYYVDMTGGGISEEFTRIINNRDLRFMGHDIKNDYYMMLNMGIDSFDTAYDTAVAQYVIDSGRSNYDITALAQEYFHKNIENEEEFMTDNGQTGMFTDDAVRFADYGLKWCGLVAQMALIQGKRINEEGLSRVLEEAELPLIRVMAAMEYEGFAVDRDVLEDTGKGIKERVDRLTEEIYDLAGEEFNIKSPVQMGPILFEKLELPGAKKTKRGYATGAEILEKIKDSHPIIPLILEYRQLTKLQGTYIDGLIPMVGKDGRIHARFNQTVAATGRISSSEPNLQNIPVRQELGRKIRKAFVPSDSGCTLMGADYSQIELRVLAHVSGDEMLIEAFNNGEDIHKATAARVLGIPEDEITPEQRSRAKAVNFGVIYGISSFGLSSNLHISRKEAEQYINDYFEQHTAVKEYMDSQVAFCRENGYVETILGRKRYISEITAKNYMVRQAGERLAMNSPIQGSAADIIKLAMIKVYEALKPYRSRLLLQVHDELIIQVYENERAEIEKILTDSMENAAELSVSLSVDLNTGKNWYELK